MKTNREAHGHVHSWKCLFVLIRLGSKFFLFHLSPSRPTARLLMSSFLRCHSVHLLPISITFPSWEYRKSTRLQFKCQWSTDQLIIFICICVFFFYVTLNQTFIFTFTCFSHTLYTVSVWRQTSHWQISPLCLIPLSCLSLTLHKKVLEIYLLKLGHLTVHILMIHDSSNLSGLNIDRLSNKTRLHLNLCPSKSSIWNE